MYLFTQINQSACPRQINRVRFELVQFGVKIGDVFSNSFAGKKRRCIFFLRYYLGCLVFLNNCHLLRPNVVACLDITCDETSRFNTSRFDSNPRSSIAQKI